MPGRFYDSVRVEYAKPKREVERALWHYLERIQFRVQLHKAILFGSYAKDSYSPGSDVDIAIIADGLPANQARRYALLKDLDLGVDLEPFAYSPEEWEAMVKAGSGFAREILRHGETLYPNRLRALRAQRRSRSRGTL